MKAKKGISLIVLVITIIVIIILAGAVILSLQKNNPIKQADKAKLVSDKDSVQSEVTIALSSAMANDQKAYSVCNTDGSAIAAGTYITMTVTSGKATISLSDDNTSTNPGKADTTQIIDVPDADGVWQIDSTGKVQLMVTDSSNATVEVSNLAV